VVEEINSQADNGHRGDKRQKQSHAVVMVEEGVNPCVQHDHHAKQCKTEYHPFFHHERGLMKRFREGRAGNIANSGKKQH